MQYLSCWCVCVCVCVRACVCVSWQINIMHWNEKVILTTLSSLTASQVVTVTAFGASGEVCLNMTFPFQYQRCMQYTIITDSPRNCETCLFTLGCVETYEITYDAHVRGGTPYYNTTEYYDCAAACSDNPYCFSFDYRWGPWDHLEYGLGHLK